jgi:hypothetical protein
VTYSDTVCVRVLGVARGHAARLAAGAVAWAATPLAQTYQTAAAAMILSKLLVLGHAGTSPPHSPPPHK